MHVSGMHLKTYATICDLPLELLLLILAHVKDWKYWLQRYCSRVCRCLRAACLELINFHTVKVYQLDSPSHFAAFIKDHPRVARSIVQLRLAGCYGYPRPTMNAASLVRILRQLPKLRKLGLKIMRFDGALDTDIYASPSPLALDGPSFRLDRLDLDHDIDEQSLLPGIFRIACMFDVEELDLGFSDRFDIASASDPFSLPRPLSVRSLKINHTIRSQEHAVVMFDALSAHLQPGVLGRLDVSVDSADGIRSLGKLLVGPACNNLALLELNSQPPVGKYGIRFGWFGYEDPLQYEWPSLNIGSCPRLESLKLHVYAQGPPSDMPLCSAAAGILSQAPPTLRRVTLNIWRCHLKNLVNAQWLGLQAVDEALSVPSRLPHLEKLIVNLRLIEIEYQQCRAACEGVLTAVHGAGKLEVVQM